MPLAIKSHTNDVAASNAARTLAARPTAELYQLLANAPDCHADRTLVCAIWMAEFPKLVSMARARGCSAAEAEDLAADRLARCLVLDRGLLDPANEGARGFLGLAVARAAMNDRRNQHRRRELQAKVLGADETTCAASDSLPHGRVSGVDEWMEEEERAHVGAQLRAVIGKLRPRDQEILNAAMERLRNPGEHERLEPKERKAVHDARKRLERVARADQALVDWAA